jgi:hypothetical protein
MSRTLGPSLQVCCVLPLSSRFFFFQLFIRFYFSQLGGGGPTWPSLRHACGQLGGDVCGSSLVALSRRGARA